MTTASPSNGQESYDHASHPDVDDFTSDVELQRYDDMLNPPGLTNFLGVAQVDHDVTGIRSLNIAPISQGDTITALLSVDGPMADAAYQAEPYGAHTGRDTTNDNDSIYEDAGLLHVEETADGYLAYLNLGVAALRRSAGGGEAQRSTGEAALTV